MCAIMGYSKKIPYGGVDAKISLFNVVLENLQTVQCLLEKGHSKICLWPEIICFVKVMMNGSMAFNSDRLENFI